MVVGIDLGMTNTRACYFVNGQKRLLKFAGGMDMLPSVIYTEDGGKVIVGQKALYKGQIEPSRMISLSEAYRRTSELNKLWKCGEQIFTAAGIAAEILREVRQRLIRNARLDENEDIGAVIAVPVYFDDNQRNEIRRAGAAAGFKVMRILEKPTAAAIEALHGRQLDKKILVIDIGFSAFELSVLDKNYTIIATDGNPIGGDDFDRAIQQEFIRRIEEDTGIKLTDAKSAGLDDAYYQSLMSQLLDEAHNVKEFLSEVTEETVTVMMPNLTTLGGQYYVYESDFTRKDLERVCKPLFDKIFNRLNDFVNVEDIGHVILAGGTCSIPYIKERIERDLGIKPEEDLPLS